MKHQLSDAMKAVMRDACKASKFKEHGQIYCRNQQTKLALLNRKLIEFAPAWFEADREILVLSSAGWQYCYEQDWMNGTDAGFNTYAADLERIFVMRGGWRWWKVSEHFALHHNPQPHTFYRPSMFVQGSLF